MSDLRRIELTLERQDSRPTQGYPAAEQDDARPRDWAVFFQRLNTFTSEPEFMVWRPLNTVSVDRDIFADDAD